MARELAKAATALGVISAVLFAGGCTSIDDYIAGHGTPVLIEEHSGSDARLYSPPSEYTWIVDRAVLYYPDSYTTVEYDGNFFRRRSMTLIEQLGVEASSP